MAEEKVDVAEKDLNEEEILDGKVESDQEDSSTSKEDSKASSGVDDKTQSAGGSAESEEPDDLAGFKEGQSIPYERFKQVIEKRNKYKSDFENLSAELKEARGYINNPDVFRAILLTKGITDKKVQDEMLREEGLEVKETKIEGDVYKSITEGLNLNTQEGWLKAVERAVKTFGKELVEPIQKKLSEKEANEWVSQEEVKARKISKETFNLEFGEVGKDEHNPNTGIGKIWAYLQKYPEDAHLGHTKLLRLALSEEGYKLGKEEGLKDAKKHNEALKRSQMEDDSGQVREGEPDSSWSVRDLMIYHRKHSKE